MNLEFLTLGLLVVVEVNAVIFPGLSANKSCEVDDGKKGKCIPYNLCPRKSNEFCDLFEEKVYICCLNNDHDVGNIHVRNSVITETGFEVKDEYSFMAILNWDSVFEKSNFKCIGVIISPKFIITSASCVAQKVGPPKYAQIGARDTTSDIIDEIAIKRVYIHPGYEAKSTYNDIALTELKLDTKKNPAKLWTWSEINGETNDAKAIGYCENDLLQNPSQKGSYRVVNLTTCPEKICEQYYSSSSGLSRGLSHGQFCAVSFQAADNSYEDLNCIAGPLLKQHSGEIYILGMWSMGRGLGEKVPGIYTRVSAFNDWISSILAKETTKEFNLV